MILKNVVLFPPPCFGSLSTRTGRSPRRERKAANPSGLSYGPEKRMRTERDAAACPPVRRVTRANSSDKVGRGGTGSAGDEGGAGKPGGCKASESAGAAGGSATRRCPSGNQGMYVSSTNTSDVVTTELVAGIHTW